MKKTNIIHNSSPLDDLCLEVKKLALEKNYGACKEIIYKAMATFPHAPHPHNLLGVILEKTGDHPLAMKHFRAAWALDPTYLPVAHNLKTYGMFFSCGNCAFDESDLPNLKRSTPQNSTDYFSLSAE